jgi:hypothetical protein
MSRAIHVTNLRLGSTARVPHHLQGDFAVLDCFGAVAGLCCALFVRIVKYMQEYTAQDMQYSVCPGVCDVLLLSVDVSHRFRSGLRLEGQRNRDMGRRLVSL